MINSIIGGLQRFEKAIAVRSLKSLMPELQTPSVIESSLFEHV
ncbi:MAG: hypothetical protein AAFW75_06590 [Cyanobacteria bacterium J06636_16]